jgi:hypothetical protein
MFLSTLLVASSCCSLEKEVFLATPGSDICEVDKSRVTGQELETFEFLARDRTDRLHKEIISPPATDAHVFPPDENPQTKRKQGQHGHQVISFNVGQTRRLLRVSSKQDPQAARAAQRQKWGGSFDGERQVLTREHRHKRPRS